jgi:hypothetical protein
LWWTEIQAFEATTFHILRSYNFVAKLYIIPTIDVQLKIILKSSRRKKKKKKRNFMDIYWNCWELNSQLIKNFFIVPTIGLLLEITAQGIHCIVFLQLLKFLKIHFEATEPCFLEYINIWQTSTHSNGRYSMQLLNISCKE